MVLKGHYIQASYNNRKYFTFGGCLVLKGQYIQAMYNNRKYLHWEGVVVLKGHYIQAIYNNREYFTLGGAEQIYWLMDIEKYFVGSPPPVLVSFQVPITSMC